MPRTKNDRDIFELAFEKALFDNAHVHFDTVFQNPELKVKFKEFCTLYHQTMVKKWFGNDKHKR